MGIEELFQSNIHSQIPPQILELFSAKYKMALQKELKCDVQIRYHQEIENINDWQNKLISPAFILPIYLEQNIFYIHFSNALAYQFIEKLLGGGQNQKITTKTPTQLENNLIKKQFLIIVDCLERSWKQKFVSKEHEFSNYLDIIFLKKENFFVLKISFSISIDHNSNSFEILIPKKVILKLLESFKKNFHLTF